MNPSDIEEFVGYNAQFECQFSHEDGVTVRLTWLINGTVLNKTPSHLCELRENTTSPNLNVIKSTLNIAATLDCNDTDVSCIAVWSNGSMLTTERSSLATFNVRGKINNDSKQGYSYLYYKNCALIIIFIPVKNINNSHHRGIKFWHYRGVAFLEFLS